MNKTLGTKLSMTHGLGQKAMKVASKIGKVAAGAGAVGAVALTVRGVAQDENVRQVGRLLRPGVSGLVNKAMQ